MMRLRLWWRRLRGVVAHGASDAELQAEFESLRDLHIDDNIRRGMTPDEARRAAWIHVGSVQGAREAYRDQARVAWMAAAGHVFRDAARSLRRRRPGRGDPAWVRGRP